MSELFMVPEDEWEELCKIIPHTSNVDKPFPDGAFIGKRTGSQWKIHMCHSGDVGMCCDIIIRKTRQTLSPCQRFKVMVTEEEPGYIGSEDKPDTRGEVAKYFSNWLEAMRFALAYLKVTRGE